MRRIIILGTAVTVLLAVSVAVAVAATPARTPTRRASRSSPTRPAASTSRSRSASRRTSTATNAPPATRGPAHRHQDDDLRPEVEREGLPDLQRDQIDAAKKRQLLPEGRAGRHRPSQRACWAAPDLAQARHRLQSVPGRLERRPGQAVVLLHDRRQRTSALGLKTGATAAYAGHIYGARQVHGHGRPASAGRLDDGRELTGLYGSLIKEVLTFKNLKTKVQGKTVGINASIGCLKGKRPYSAHVHGDHPCDGSQTRRSRAAPSAELNMFPPASRLPRRRVLDGAPSWGAVLVQATSNRSARWASRSDSVSICTNSTTSAIPITIDCSSAITSPAIF